VTRAPDEPGSDWQPATSQPGEIFTVEGKIGAAGALARGLKGRDRRGREYRRSMMRVAGAVLGVGVAVALIAVVLF
jgi:hypothetical protein